MYSTCLFCNQDLGRNQEIESFPVGRRLAFDAATGRLWVVCRTCGRWNLTPMEERWEAIEQCERLFRATRLRVSTDNIGLARMRDGSELVRVGKPERPELAAWRYGDVFGRRRWRAVVGAVTSAAGGAALNYAPLVPVIGYALPVVGVVGLFGWASAAPTSSTPCSWPTRMARGAFASPACSRATTPSGGGPRRGASTGSCAVTRVDGPRLRCSRA